jgi:hypothetical protein
MFITMPDMGQCPKNLAIPHLKNIIPNGQISEK